MSKNNFLLQVQDLKKYFYKEGLFSIDKRPILAVNGISFSIQRGETLGLVGERGCGKTTAGRTILGLYPVTGGKVIISGIPVGNASREQMKSLRRKAQMIFQDPYASLNPRWTVSAIIGEPLRVRRRGPGRS